MLMLAKGAGVPLVLISIPLVLALALSFFYLPSIFLSLILFILLAIALIFFRDPERQISSGIVCPADGKIIKLGKTRLTIYMGLHNVHVNRSPVSGDVVSIKHIPGKHSPANIGDCENNERMIYHIDTKHGMVKVTQIAGIIARRTVSYVSKGATVKRGQRLGMIRFGSRVELELPPGARLTVEKGDIVKAGETSLGVWE